MAGWSVRVVWECEVANKEVLTGKIKDFLGV
jgi:G:T-mismatch repair DNA endonuclease (very short patch repair protein)